MTKQERLYQLIEINPKWWLLRSTFALPFGVLWYLFMQTEHHNLIYGGLLMGIIAMAANLFIYDSRTIKKLSSNDDAKQIVDIQHGFDYALLVMLGVVLPFMMKLNLINASTFILFAGGLLLIAYTQQKLDGQLRRIDSEQPTRQEIQRTRFRFST